MGKVKCFKYRFFKNDTGKTFGNCKRNNKEGA